MALVKVTDLVKRYTSDGVNAVDGITFEVLEGEIFSLLGPNGAGKTTTLSVLSTLLTPTSGDVTVSGHAVTKEPMEVRRSIGVVPQELAVYEELSAYENLRFWGEMRGLYGKNLTHEIEEKLELTGLSDRSKDRVKTFSGGMKRRLNLAVGLLGNPPLMMLDEPTVAIDPQSRRYILDWVKEVNRNGITVLYTTHYMEEAQELSDRIGIIDHGQLIAVGTLEELTEMVGQNETLVLSMGVETAPGTEDFVAQLAALDGVIQASAADGEVVINVVSAEAALPAIISKASGLGLNVRTVEIREPNLEAVFLHLTGRALRD
ncbi:MAG: ATP-binding cassette domain-containing protein [Chloroflexi bacterium]|jgi:ABC-2 type transport system ATP-binding protein|nr:ATP-binding cassette domain-containing protein [Chloroflexota bacterium]